MQQSDILLQHVLRTTLMSLDILEQQSIITPSDVSSIRSKLQNRLAASPPHHAQPLLQQQPHQMTAMYQSPPMEHHVVPPLPPRQPSLASVQQDDSQSDKAVALWDYAGTAADDLNFRKDDIIVIDQELNQEWYRGHLQNDPSRRSALFPHNYVQKIPRDGTPIYPSVSLMPPPMGNPEHNEKQPLYHQPQSQPYPQDPPKWQQGPPPMMYNNPPPGPPQGFPYKPQQQPPPQLQSPQPQQNQPPTVPAKKPNKFGKVGGQLGHSFVNGTGFGAGAAIGSGIVNAIF